MFLSMQQSYKVIMHVTVISCIGKKIADNNSLNIFIDATVCQLHLIFTVKLLQEEGWVVCRVFKKKNHQRGPPSETGLEENLFTQLKTSGSTRLEQKQPLQMPYDFSFDNSMHLPQLLSSESIGTPFMPSVSLNLSDIECSQNLMKLTTGEGGVLQQEKLNVDWSILEKLLASHQNLDQIFQSRFNLAAPSQSMDNGCSVQRFPLQYLGCETDFLKFTK